MTHTVFIHTNEKQIIGALVATHALKRNSAAPERFDVRIITTEEFPFLAARQGQIYLREGHKVAWNNHDLQSFTPLRFAVPELMGYRGRAVITDPDIFAVGDINDLFDLDMGTAAIMARRMDADFRRPLHYASSVMLLDCSRLTHWQAERDFARLFAFERDYRDWMWLLLEAPGMVASLAPAWNDFDHLDGNTKLLHNTHRRTQPWKTGLPADFTNWGTTRSSRLSLLLRRIRSLLDGAPTNGYYQAHPDPAQERLFFSLLAECLAAGSITRDLLAAEIARNHVRADAFALLDGLPAQRAA